MPVIDTSGNSASGTTGATYQPATTDQMYKALIKPIRDADAVDGGLLLKRFLTRPQFHADSTGERIASLALTDDPATCREDVLQYLKVHVGLTKELDSITSRLTTNNLRKLIQIAVPLWKRKGSTEGLLDIARLLTGRTAYYRSWFDYRNILGEACIGDGPNGSDNWLIGGSNGTYDEYISTLRVMNADGALDTQLLLDLVSLFRPNGETLELAVVDFLDRFEDAKDKWTSFGAASAYIDPTVQNLVMPPGADEELLVATGLYSNYYHFHQHKFKLGASGNVHQFRFNYLSGLAWYTVTISLTSPTVTLVVHGSNGVDTTLYSGTPAAVPLSANNWFRLRTEAGPNPDPLAREVKVYLDDNLICDVVDADAHSPGVGHQRIVAPNTNAANNLVDDVEAFTLPLRFATVAPSGTTKTSNF
jgi:hypothetical protein